jgi:hypothetical protein
MIAHVGYSVAERSGGWVMLCSVCIVHEEMNSTGFLVEPQNQGRRFASGLASKPLEQFSSVWPQNRWRQFSLVWPQNRWLGFLGLGLKADSYGLVIWTLKSPRQFLGVGLKTKQASVCRLCHKIDGGRMTWDTRRDLVVTLGFSRLALRLTETRRHVVYVAPSWRLY